MSVRVRQLLTISAYLVLASTIAWIVWIETSALEVGVFGRPGAPHSDALGPWLNGGLEYILFDRPHAILYRPTIGIYYASILSAVFDTRAIPLFFIIATIAFMAAIIHRLDGKHLLALGLWMGTGAIGYGDYFSHLAPWTLSVDFASWFITFAGVIVSCMAIDNRRPLLLILAALLLGIAGAIRGPMLAVGPLFLILAAWTFRGEVRRWRYVGAAFLVFVLPFCIDVAIQKQYAVVNNGILSLYCFYADPMGTFTMRCDWNYRTLRPGAVDVVSAYLSHLFSLKGAGQVFSNVATMWLYAVAPLVGAMAPLALVSIVAAGVSFFHTRGHSPLSMRLAILGGILASLALLVHLLGAERLEAVLAAAVIFLLVALPLWSYRNRSLWVACLFVAFAVSTLFLALLGLSLPRLVETFAFTLQLAVYITLLEALRMRPDYSRPPRQLPSDIPLLGAFVVGVFFLYSANFLFDPPFKKIYLDEVKNRPAAIKVSSDKGMDRSLYYLGDHNFFYTRYEGSPVGSVVTFSRLENDRGQPAALNNASIFDPGHFVR